MRVGTVCYATEQGIGRMAKALYDNGIVTDPIVVRHPHYPTHAEWYPGARVVERTDTKSLEDHCSVCDAMVFVETPFHWGLFNHCRAKGVRTTLIPMYEWTTTLHRNSEHYWPDTFLCVSLLDYDYFVQSDRAKYLPWPVSYPWRCRNEARVFVHNAGHGGARGRNGTAEFLAATRLVRSDAKFIVRCQPGGPVHGFINPRLDVRIGDCPYEELFAEGDVFVFPEKFAGDSLPLAEARASGMLVMASDRYPMSRWLPQEPLIPVREYRKAQVGTAYLEFYEAVVSPEDIARRIDGWYGRDITEYSLTGRAWADTMSWSVHKDSYLEVICGCT